MRVGVLIGDVPNQCRYRRGGRTGIQRDDEVAAAAAPGEGPDGHALIGDVRPAHSDLARPRPLVADRQHIFGAVTPRRETYGQRPGIEVRRVNVGDHGIATFDHHRLRPLAVGPTVPTQARDRRRRFARQQPNPINLRVVANDDLRFDGPGLEFKVPIASKSGISRIVDTRCHISTGQLAQQRGRILTGLAFGKIAAIDQDVSLL